jgi:hypothetical protein
LEILIMTVFCNPGTALPQPKFNLGDWVEVHFEDFDPVVQRNWWEKFRGVVAGIVWGGNYDSYQGWVYFVDAHEQDNCDVPLPYRTEALEEEVSPI